MYGLPNDGENYFEWPNQASDDLIQIDFMKGLQIDQITILHHCYNFKGVQVRLNNGFNSPIFNIAKSTNKRCNSVIINRQIELMSAELPVTQPIHKM